MSTNITLKRSAVQNKVPVVGDLALGEIAINTYDGKLFIKKNVGGTESIVTLSELTANEILTSIKTVDGAGSGLDADVLDGLSSTQFLRSDANTTFTSGAVSFSANTSLLGDRQASFAGFTMPQNPEGKHVSSPFFFNDIAYARLRGATVSVLVDSTPMTNTFYIDAMLNASTDNWNVSTVGVTNISITMTNLPKNFYYTSHMGITFGASFWRARNIVQEYSRDNGATWTTLTNVTNQTEEFYLQSFDATATPVNALRWTLSNFIATSLRVVSLFAYDVSSAGMEGLYVTRNGGTIYGQTTITGASLNLGQNATGTEGGELNLYNPGNGSTGWTFDVAGANVGRIWSLNSNAVLQLGQSANTGGIIQFLSEGSEKARLAANGNLGIGTTTPAYKLDVAGGARVIGAPLLLGNNFAGEGGKLQFLNSDGTTVGWNIDIPSTNDALRIFSSANNCIMQIGQRGAGTGGNIQFFTEATEKVRLAANGNLGIGTTTPAAKLEISGGDVRLNSAVNLSAEAITLATVTKTQIASFAVASFRSGKLIVQAYNSVTGEVQISELLVAHNGTTASATEYGVVFTGSVSFVTYDVDISSGNVRLMVTNATANSTQYKVSETLMVA